jgi:outer membrane beta-barrel protein
MKWFLPFLFISSLSAVHAEEVEFPDEELSRESVLPVFQNRADVLHRHVVTEKRVEIGIGGGLVIDEPFYNDAIMSGHLGYHFTDQHGIHIEGLYWIPGLSSYGQKIMNDSRFNQWDARKAPHALWGAIGNYEFTAYYGKVSLTKQSVMNLNLFGYAGPLYINMAGYNAFGANVGLGQNFFVSPHFAIRFDLRMLIFNAPNAATQDLSNTALIRNPHASDFQTRIYFNNQAQLSLVYLL